MHAEKTNVRAPGMGRIWKVGGGIAAIMLVSGIAQANPVQNDWDDACLYMNGTHRDLPMRSTKRGVDCGGGGATGATSGELIQPESLGTDLATTIVPQSQTPVIFAPQSVANSMVQKPDDEAAPLFTPEVPLILAATETDGTESGNVAASITQAESAEVEDAGSDEDSSGEATRTTTNQSDPVAVPEPSAAWLMMLGVFALLGMRRHKMG